MSAWQGILLALGMVVSVLLAGFFSGIETGMMSVNSARLMHWVHSGVEEAKRLYSFITDMQRTLATILVGTNLMNVLLSTLSAYAATHYFAEYPVWQTTFSCFSACMMLYLGDYLPKLLFASRPLRRTVAACPLFSCFAWVLTPFTKLVMALTERFVPKADSKSNDKFLMSLDYLENIVTDKKKGADISPLERLMIQRVLSLRSRTAGELMIPIDKVDKVTEEMSIRDCCQAVRQSGQVRVPVFNADSSLCVGILNVLDELYHKTPPGTLVKTLQLRSPAYADIGELADNLLPQMRLHRCPFVIVRRGADIRPIGIVTESILLDLLTGDE
ncbi:MAG: DUF21 domain-containing protein [Kiritimatiellae bacterium]|nr:DUF21 domain-containing protein [Kiritimatiellia bacterium]